VTTEPPRSSLSPEPTCRNCGAVAPGAYCPACGQETRLRLQTFREFMREAAGRYVAFDGRWWKSVAALMFRPGFLTREYFAGRRRRYVRPARLFLIASLLLFAVLRIATDLSGVQTIGRGSTEQSVATGEAQGSPDAKGGATGKQTDAPPIRENGATGVQIDDELDLRDIENQLPVLKGRIERFGRMSPADRLEQMVSGMLRYGPYAAFALLPAFAALLKVLYLGRRRSHPHRPRLYGEHLVFAAHNHAFLFFDAVAAIVIPVTLVRTALIVWACVYLLRSLRAVYGGSWLGIAARSFVMSIAYMVLFGLVTAGLVVAAILLR
jgi:hypothetical protein